MRSPEENSWNDALMADFRSHAGQITQGRLAGSKMLLMTSIGARTGQPRICPLGYHRDGERYVIVGSNNGKDVQPSWLANVTKNPLVTVEVGTEKFQARATVTDGAERRRLLDDRIAAVPIFGEYEKKAHRDLPVVVLERLDKPEGSAG
jgi:deazaflavin-dependent oxidoreductase (nitroreductase family)